MSIQATMEDKLNEAFSPERLVVVNESHLHAGHHHHRARTITATFDGTGETHFRVRIVSPAFAGMSRIDRHRAVNELLAEELAGGCMRWRSSRPRPAKRRAGEPAAIAIARVSQTVYRLPEPRLTGRGRTTTLQSGLSGRNRVPVNRIPHNGNRARLDHGGLHE